MGGCGLVAIFVTKSGAGGAEERSFRAPRGPREPWPSVGAEDDKKDTNQDVSATFVCLSAQRWENNLYIKHT